MSRERFKVPETVRILFGLGLLTGLLTALLSLTPVAELLELKGYDLLHAPKRHLKPPHEIVIVTIDEASFAEIARQWPWPRSLHGRLVEAITREQAAVIAFDILFPEPSEAKEDRLLAAAIRKAGNVVLAADLESLEDRKYAGETLVEPLELFREGAATGLATVSVDPDGVVRRYPPAAIAGPTMAETVADIYLAAEFRGKNPVRVPAGAYISYYGPPHTFATVSYYQALNPSTYLPAGFFKDKIVLVGRAVKTAPEIQKPGPDLFATPFLFAQKSPLMAGVEVHANMLLGLLSQRFVERPGWQGRLLMLLLLGFVGAATQVRWKPLRGGVLAIGFLAGYWVCAYGLFSARGLWVPTLLPVLSFSIPYGSMALYAYSQSERRRREIRKAFAHYLSPAILEEILRNPDSLKLGGSRLEATILFSDLAGFTSMAEKVSPERVSLFLNRYFSEMAAVVLAHQGTIDKFIGDAVMAFWGAPLADPDQALHACQAALAMQERMRSLGAEAKQQGLPEMHMRIGIHTGEVIAGNMGSSELFNYTVLGDTVNLASRLEAANKAFGTEILISHAVHTRAGSRITARPLGRIEVKGRTAEVEVLELLGTNAAG